jgi:molybdate transport system substrate-binding protein
VDIVIVADAVLREFIRDGLVLPGTYTPIVRSAIGMAVRAGAPIPDIGTAEALKQPLLQAKSIAYSASVSGQYLTSELYQRLGIDDQMTGKSRLIGGGEAGRRKHHGFGHGSFSDQIPRLPRGGPRNQEKRTGTHRQLTFNGDIDRISSTFC